MSPRVRAGRFWESVRPRTRRGALLAAGGILGGVVLLSAVLFVGAAMAWSPYLDFAIHHDANAKQWAALDMKFASSSVCASCHVPESTKLATNPHNAIGCQSCHGPLLDHALASRNAAKTTVRIAVPTDEVCVRCHVQADGRPTTLRQIVPGQHYVAQCLQCHDPHTAIAQRPPIVRHPQANLPPCLTCHGPEGFKARNQRHPDGALTDQQCLQCHAAGRGPDEPLVAP